MRQLFEQRQAEIEQKRYEREQGKRLRSGEAPPAGHGTERLNHHNARLTGATPPQVQVTKTAAPTASSPITKEDSLPPSLRVERRERTVSGLGEKLYRVA